MEAFYNSFGNIGALASIALGVWFIREKRKSKDAQVLTNFIMLGKQ